MMSQAMECVHFMSWGIEYLSIITLIFTIIKLMFFKQSGSHIVGCDRMGVVKGYVKALFILKPLIENVQFTAINHG